MKNFALPVTQSGPLGSWFLGQLVHHTVSPDKGRQMVGGRLGRGWSCSLRGQLSPLCKGSEVKRILMR